MKRQVLLISKHIFLVLSFKALWEYSDLVWNVIARHADLYASIVYRITPGL
jgi:hypothetical protein